ncbi:prenylcysteine oxidase-like isoform X1 [Pongo pygmaeus]|nr:prenylcysteine oxidase-like isoform X1 [Pongo pygmaeus]
MFCLASSLPPGPADSGGWGRDWGLCCGPFSPAALWTSGADRRVREGNRGWPPGHHLSQQAALRERGCLLPLPEPAHAGLRQAAGWSNGDKRGEGTCLRLHRLRHRREVVGRSAIFGGEHFMLEETDWYLLNLFRLWWHYGISFLRLQMWVEEVMEKFMRIYKYQAHGYAFSGVEELLYSLGESTFVNMTQHSVAESLLQVGVTQRFIDDVVSAVLRASYGQSAAMPAFAGAMSLAGAQGSLWSVEGGNKLVCSGLLKLTKANVIHATVTSVTLHSTEGKALYQVAYENEVGNSSDLYDIVVIATPLHLDNSSSNLTFAGFHPPIDDVQGSFQPTVVSLVHGYLNSSYFGFPDPKLFPFANILTTDFPSFFCTLDNICPVNISASFRRKQPQEAAVWRVQSPKPLFRTQLKTLFRSYYSVQTAEWQAHPLYGSRPTLPRFALHDQLFYLNALEWAASSVEVMAVAAKNVALLAYNRWYQDLDKIDQKDLMHKVKTEL